MAWNLKKTSFIQFAEFIFCRAQTLAKVVIKISTIIKKMKY